MTEDAIRVVVLSDKEADLAAIGESQGLTRADDREVEELALDPISAAILVGGALAVGRFIIHLINTFRGGVHIDLKSEPVKISRNSQVPYGWVVIVAADLTVKIETKDEPKDAVERMVESILKLPVQASVDMVKAAIESIKPDTKVEPVPTGS